jgi:hypothetical protein
MAGERSSQKMQSQNFSFVVTGDAAQIWAHWSGIPLTQIATDLDRGGERQGPVFEKHPTSGADLLGYEASKKLPHGTALACTQVGFPLLRSFINVPLNLMLIQNEKPSSLITEMEFKRDDEKSSAGTLIFREKLSQVRALNDETAEECGHISGFIETEIRFNQNLHPEGQIRIQVFATMNSSMPRAHLELKLANPKSYERILGTFSGLSLSLSALFINDQLVPLQIKSLAPEARLESKAADDDLRDDLALAAGEGDSLLGGEFRRTVEVRMDFSINASSIRKLWMKVDQSSLRQAHLDERRAGIRYLDEDTQRFAERFMNQQRATAILSPDTLNNLMMSGLSFMLSGSDGLSGRGAGGRDFFVSPQSDGSHYLSTRSLDDLDTSNSLTVFNESLESIGSVKLARGYMRIPGSENSRSDNKATWGYQLIMSVDDSFDVTSVDDFLRKNLQDNYFRFFGGFLHQPTRFDKTGGFKVSSASVAMINPQALVPMTLRAAPPVVVAAAPPVERYIWGQYDDPNPAPQVSPPVSSNVSSRRNSLEVAVAANQSPMVPRGLIPSEKMKVSFAKGAAIAAAFLVVFVVVAAATHGVGVAPMLWAGVTLMTSLTGGLVGSAGILGFLGLGGGIGAGVRAKLNSRREALALARPNVGGDGHSTQSEGSSSPIPGSSGLVPRSRTGSLENELKQD